MCLELTLEFQESNLKALKVLEIGFRSWMTFIFLLNRIENINAYKF